MILLVCMLVSVGSAAEGNQVNDPYPKGGSMTATFELPHGTPEEVGMSGERLSKVAMSSRNSSKQAAFRAP